MPELYVLAEASHGRSGCLLRPDGRVGEGLAPGHVVVSAAVTLGFAVAHD